MSEGKADLDLAVSKKANLSEALEWIAFGNLPYEPPYDGLFSKEWSSLSEVEIFRLEVAKRDFLKKVMAKEICLYVDLKNDVLTFTNDEIETKPFFIEVEQIRGANIDFEGSCIEGVYPRDPRFFDGMASNVYIFTDELLEKFPSKNQIDPSISIISSGMPGRPSAKHLYLKELQNRVAQRNLEDTLSNQAKVLLQWMNGTYPEINPGTLGTVRNNIRATYNRAKAA